MSYFLGHFHNIKGPEWEANLDAMRAICREHNKELPGWRLSSCGTYEVRKRWKIMVRYRLGRNNPDRALYHHGGRHYRWSGLRIYREHAQYAGVYLYKYSEFRNVKSYGRNV